jgi:hypothetical protein
MVVEYPKALYGKGWDDLSDYRQVKTHEEERQARLEGYKTLTESTEKPEEPRLDPVPTVEIDVKAPKIPLKRR